MKRNRRTGSQLGFTVLELLIVCAIIGTVVTIIGYFVLFGVVIKGNFWVSDDGALRCVQIVEPSAAKLVKLERNATSLSVVTVEDYGGTRSTFTLDSDVLFNADCAKVEGGSTP